MGATNEQVGWLTSGPALLNLLWLIPCGRLIERAPSYRLPLIVGMVGQRVLLACIALAPFFPAPWRPWVLVVIAALVSVPQTMWILSFQSAMGEMFAPRRMTIFMGQRWSLGGVSSMLFNWAMGKLLDLIVFPLNFQAIYLVSGVLTQSSVLMALRLRFPPRARSAAAPESGPRRPSLAQTLRQHRAFARFELGVLAGYVAVYAALPLFAIYWVRDLGASGAWVGALNGVSAAGSMVGTFLWGRWCNVGKDRRNLLIASCGYMAAYPLLTSLFGSLTPLLAVAVFAGFVSGGNELQMFNRVVRLAPRDQRPSFIALHNMTLSLAAVVAPLISTALATQLGARTVLTLSGVLGIAGALLIYGVGWGKENAVA
jgi:MFS family permease